MKTLLYIGHDYHNKTKSTQFLQEIFKTKYQVECFSYDPYSDTEEVFNKLEGKHYDILVLFQMMLPLDLLKKHIKFSKGVFFPMYDYYAGNHPLDFPVWEEYRNFNIINFSRTLHTTLKDVGFSSFYIQYFPKPISFSNWGDEHSLFFWQRTNQVTIETITQLFDMNDIKHLHFHQAIDPGCNIIYPAESWKEKISYSTWYDTKEDMQRDMEKSSIYIAPRLREGIGMSFLEAMAMGRCVVAPNNPTMNEYIEHNKTGILYNPEAPTKLQLENIREIQKQTIQYMEQGYEKWEKEKFLILEWLEQEPECNLELLTKHVRKNIFKRFLDVFFKVSSSPDTLRVRILGIRVFKMKRTH